MSCGHVGEYLLLCAGESLRSGEPRRAGSGAMEDLAPHPLRFIRLIDIWCFPYTAYPGQTFATVLYHVIARSLNQLEVFCWMGHWGISWNWYTPSLSHLLFVCFGYQPYMSVGFCKCMHYCFLYLCWSAYCFGKFPAESSRTIWKIQSHHQRSLPGR